jgi:hypothetical protein
MVLVTVSPSPVAVIEMKYVPGMTVVSGAPSLPMPAVTVSVEEPVPAALSATELLLQEAERKAGRPLTLRVTGPMKEVPASATIWLAVLSAVPIAPIGFTTLMLADEGIIDNVGEAPWAC